MITFLKRALGVAILFVILEAIFMGIGRAPWYAIFLGAGAFLGAFGVIAALVFTLQWCFE